MTNAAEWLPLLPQDLDSVNVIADRVYETLPERPDVFAEKATLFPEGCRKLVLSGAIVGYGLSHPWMLNSIPPLDGFLKELTKRPECLYLYDIVVLPEARGGGASARYVEYGGSLKYSDACSHAEPSGHSLWSQLMRVRMAGIPGGLAAPIQTGSPMPRRCRATHAPHSQPPADTGTVIESRSSGRCAK